MRLHDELFMAVFLLKRCASVVFDPIFCNSSPDTFIHGSVCLRLRTNRHILSIIITIIQ